MRATGGAGEVLPRSAVTRSRLLKLRVRRPLKPGGGGYSLHAIDPAVLSERAQLSRAVVL